MKDKQVLIGLDIGYGAVKALTALPGGKALIFPSVAGRAREIKFRAEELAGRYPGDQVTDDRGAWFVGDLATKQVPVGELLRLRGRTGADADEFRRLLALTALGKLLAGQVKQGDVAHVRLATGLPVDHMKDSGRLKGFLLGKHRIQTDASDFVADVVEIMVMPQPYGAIYSQMLTATGEINVCHTSKRTGVIDVGTYTVDLALDDDGEFVDAESGSAEGGVHTAQERIAAFLEAEHRQKPSFAEVEAVLRTGCFRAAGEAIDYAAEVAEALEPLRDATLNLARTKWRQGVSVDTIYLAGGGAALVFDVVKAAFKQTQMLDNAQLANTRGYLNYALAVQKG